ncbi:unnamed protein product [Hyaloperonospora brassicae]|uniref:RxLR effector candidate protein n=1 Tax=Hyaloperonospora brassicae TaxID=162125 RepID=A0AAV0T633_HYABA|nr:unnamed protein product [Hyaloperonospora brassicae]
MRLAYTAVAALITVFVCIDAVPKAVRESSDSPVVRRTSGRVNEVNTKRRLGVADLHDGGPPLASDKEARNGPTSGVGEGLVQASKPVTSVLEKGLFGTTTKQASQAVKAVAAMKAKAAEEQMSTLVELLRSQALTTKVKPLRSKAFKEKVKPLQSKDFKKKAKPSQSKAAQKNAETVEDAAKAKAAEEQMSTVRKYERTLSLQKNAETADDLAKAKAKAGASDMMKTSLTKKITKVFKTSMSQLRRQSTSEKGVATAFKGFIDQLRAFFKRVLNNLRQKASSVLT